MGLPLNSVVQVAIDSICVGQRVMAVFNYRVSVVSTKPNPADEMGALLVEFTSLGAGKIMTAYIACCPGNQSILRCTAQPVFPIRYRRATRALALAGQRGNCVQASTAAVLTMQTALAGRDQVGSKHIVTSTVNDVSNGLINQTFRETELQTLATVMNQLLVVADGGGSYQPVIYHGKDASPAYHDLNAVFVQPTARVMRRRTVGVGE